MAELKDISHTHDMVMNWMLENPHRLLRDCAAYFGYTQAWLSSMIHTDAFQARLKEKQGDIFSAIASDIPSRLNGLASLAIERLEEKLEVTNDGDFILDSFDKILHRAGYAPKKEAASLKNETNVYVISPTALAAARASMTPLPIASPQPEQEVLSVDHEAV